MLLFTAGVLLLLSLPAQVSAGDLAQAVYFTPTAGPDGRIIYKVKSGDTCLSISLLTGVDMDQLRKLNNLNLNCDITEGQDLLLGLGGPAEESPTPGPSPTPTPPLPTPTPFNGTGQVCIVLFNDINGDAMRQTDSELLVANGAISMSDSLGKFSRTETSKAGEEPVCFLDVPEGQYNISVAIPEGLNPTTVMNYTINVVAGDQAVLDFGSQVSAKALPLPPSEGGHSPVLGIVGGLILLVGLGLGIYIWRSNK